MSRDSDVKNALVDIKKSMYDILVPKLTTTDVNINAEQVMGVALTNAVKKDGVNIIQLQNVVNQEITHNVVNVLKQVDDLQHTLNLPVIEPELVIDDNRAIGQSLDYVMQDLLEKELSWDEFMDLMKLKFISAASDRYKTNKEIANAIGLKPAYIGKLKLRYDIIEKTNKIVKQIKGLSVDNEQEIIMIEKKEETK